MRHSELSIHWTHELYTVNHRIIGLLCIIFMLLNKCLWLNIFYGDMINKSTFQKLTKNGLFVHYQTQIHVMLLFIICSKYLRFAWFDLDLLASDPCASLFTSCLTLLIVLITHFKYWTAFQKPSLNFNPDGTITNKFQTTVPHKLLKPLRQQCQNFINSKAQDNVPMPEDVWVCVSMCTLAYTRFLPVKTTATLALLVAVPLPCHYNSS